MKKFLYLSAISLFLAACSGNDVNEIINPDSENKTPQLVKATITASADKETRVFIGTIEGGVMKQTFEASDEMDVFDDWPTKNVFSNINNVDRQDAKFEGYWTSTQTSCAVMLPSKSDNYYTTNGTQKTFSFTVPTEQTSVSIVSNTMVSCDPAANILVGLQDSKFTTDNDARGINLYSTCSFLYFCSYSPTITVTSTTNNIAGATTLTAASRNNFTDLADITDHCTITSSSKSITAHGVNGLDRSKEGYDKNLYEYIVCVTPGTYAAGTLSIGSKLNTKSQKLEVGKMYYLGEVQSSVQLVKATIPTEVVNVDDQEVAANDDTKATRVFIGTIESGVMKQTFEASDEMDVFDDWPTKNVFSNINNEDRQDAKFEGYWTNTQTSCAVMLPSKSDNNYTTNGTQKIFSFTVPTEQTSVSIVSNTMVSCDPAANILVGLQDSKFTTDNDARGINLYSTCSFLYFCSYSPTITVTSTTNNIAGATTLTAASRNNFTDITDITAHCTIASSNKVITAHGVNGLDRNKVGYDKNLYEYIVCVTPGTYAAGTLSIGSKLNTKSQNLEVGKMYYLGEVTGSDNGENSNGTEPFVLE